MSRLVWGQPIQLFIGYMGLFLEVTVAGVGGWPLTFI